jgi:hypothetical protein
MAEDGEPQELPDRDVLLQDLARARYDRSINVAAIKLLLEELRREDDGAGGSEFDDLDGDEGGNVHPIRRSA